MVPSLPFSPRPSSRTILLAVLLGVLGVVLAIPAAGQQGNKIDVLHIGTSGTLALDESGGKQATAQDTLQSFIRSETGFENDIIAQKDWAELADKMANGQLHLGVFQGYEFAWAKEKYPKL